MMREFWKPTINLGSKSSLWRDFFTTYAIHQRPNMYLVKGLLKYHVSPIANSLQWDTTVPQNFEGSNSWRLLFNPMPSIENSPSHILYVGKMYEWFEKVCSVFASPIHNALLLQKGMYTWRNLFEYLYWFSVKVRHPIFPFCNFTMACSKGLFCTILATDEKWLFMMRNALIPSSKRWSAVASLYFSACNGSAYVFNSFRLL